MSDVNAAMNTVAVVSRLVRLIWEVIARFCHTTDPMYLYTNSAITGKTDDFVVGLSGYQDTPASQYMRCNLSDQHNSCVGSARS